MEIFKYSIIVISLILSFAQIIKVQANTSCAKEIQAKAARAQADCMATKKNAPECVRGYNIAISSIPIICGTRRSGRKKRFSPGHCVYSPNFRSSMCFTGENFYEFGQVASEPCHPGNHGKQKCVDSETVITCVWTQWIIKEKCAADTTCQAYPGSNRRILCG